MLAKIHDLITAFLPDTFSFFLQTSGTFFM